MPFRRASSAINLWQHNVKSHSHELYYAYAVSDNITATVKPGFLEWSFWGKLWGYVLYVVPTQGDIIFWGQTRLSKINRDCSTSVSKSHKSEQWNKTNSL